MGNEYLASADIDDADRARVEVEGAKEIGHVCDTPSDLARTLSLGRDATLARTSCAFLGDMPRASIWNGGASPASKAGQPPPLVKACMCTHGG